MTRMEEHCRETGLIWKATAFGQPLGLTFKGTTTCLNTLKDPGALPTEEAARRVVRAFSRWMRDRHPGREMPSGGQYFMAFADGPVKVGKSWKPENESVRKAYGNCWREQSDAHVASQALAWLCERERQRFEDGVQYARTRAQERPVGALEDQS